LLRRENRPFDGHFLSFRLWAIQSGLSCLPFNHSLTVNREPQINPFLLCLIAIATYQTMRTWLKLSILLPFLASGLLYFRPDLVLKEHQTQQLYKVIDGVRAQALHLLQYRTSRVVQAGKTSNQQVINVH
jgi:O-antigen ligase